MDGPEPVRIGTAGWSIASRHAAAFPPEGSQLQRYAARFDAVEINSSFHRPHRRETYERWAASVPDRFRFAAKLPKTVTHERRLGADAAELVARFAGEVAGLGDKLAVVLVQLPPSLIFDMELAAAFFEHAQASLPVRMVCEPRHLSWFGEEADAFLARGGIARVAADPALCPQAALPGGWRGLSYWRLHGSPVTYRSNYEDAFLAGIAVRLLEESGAGRDVWCVFDNTTLAHATPNALELQRRVNTVGVV